MAIFQQLPLLAAGQRFQFFNLLQVCSAVGAHPLNQVSNGHLPLHFRVEGRLEKVGSLEASQQTQVVMTPQPVERNQFRGTGIEVVQIAGPCVLIQRRDDGLCIRQHLSKPVSIDDLDIREVTEDFQHAPFFRGRLVAQDLFRQTRDSSRNLFRALLSCIQVFLKLNSVIGSDS